VFFDAHYAVEEENVCLLICADLRCSVACRERKLAGADVTTVL
jgi:hypothetical protein